MKAIHNDVGTYTNLSGVVVYPKDTKKWKQFTTKVMLAFLFRMLLCIPKILKNESNSQRVRHVPINKSGCCVSQRY